MKNKNYFGFLWHAIFLSLTTTFTEVNTIIPTLIVNVGGSSVHVGIVSAIVIGLPVVTKLFFSSFLSSQSKKKPYLLLGINLRILALISIAFTLVSYQKFNFISLIILLYFELLVFSVGGAFASLPYVYLLGGSLSKEMRMNFFTKRQLITSIGMLLSVITARYILANWEYPNQYVLLFAISSISLLIASFGFWIIKETPTKKNKKVSTLSVIRSIPTILKQDRNFLKFLLYSNILGAALALIPFYIGFAQKTFNLDSTTVGYVLIIQIAGMFISSFIYPKLIKNRGFKGVLYLRIFLHVLLPLIAVIIANLNSLVGYLSIFFFIGFALSARTISEEAALIELTNEDNRVVYTALVGTLNFAIIIFPLILGTLIDQIGYSIIFIISSLLTLIALPILKSLICPIDIKN